jgi:hypothetical protein
MALTFEQWFDSADHICQLRSGLRLDDLPDGPSWDAWDNDISPANYVYDQLREAGYYQGGEFA